MNKKIQIPVLATFAVGVLWTTGLAVRAEEAESLEELKAKLLELDQKVKTLERNSEVEKEANEAKTKEAPKITVGDQGFSFGSADGNFSLQFKGVLQVDSRSFFDDGGINGNDGFLIRRARPVLQGTVYHDFDFLFVPDFGTGSNGGNSGSQPTPQIYDAYLNYRYKPELQLRVGKFKSPVGLEQLVVDVDTLFNERALPTGLTPNRDLGFELWGDIADGVVSYAAGVFNGAGDARNSSLSDLEDNKEFAGRIFIRPFKKLALPALQGFGFGLGGSYGKPSAAAALPATTGGTLPGYATDGQQQFFAYNPTNKAVVVANGEHWRLSPQGYYYYGPFGLLGEYVISDQRVSRTVTAPLTSARLEHTGWEITGSWILTGEEAAYKGGVVPRQPFNPLEGRWGALQVVGRYAELDIDKGTFPLFADSTTSAHSAASWSAGLNWYLNRNVVVKTSFSHTTFGGGGGAGTTAPAIVTRQPENVLFTRVQLAF